jgi:hypothetical protein
MKYYNVALFHFDIDLLEHWLDIDFGKSRHLPEIDSQFTVDKTHCKLAGHSSTQFQILVVAIVSMN